MQLSATEVRVLSRLIERTLALPPEQREAYLAGLPGPQQALVPRIRERLAQLAETAAEAEAAVAPPPPRPAKPDVRVGPYRLLEPLGADAQARVWAAERAEGGARQRFVLRLPDVPPAGADASPPSPEEVRRQAAERQVVLLPEHTDIVRLIDAGIDTDGRFYRVLPHIEGPGLIEHAQRRGLGLHGRVALLRQVCRLVAHVHDEEVACTALGPASLRVDDEGRVRLLDWGRGRSLRPDTRAEDLAALGQLLQALLEAGGPGPGPDVAQILRRALRQEGAAPYKNVQALIDELNLVLDWQPVPGAGGGTLYLARLWLRRHRLRLALGAVAALLLGAAAWAGWQTWQRGQGQAQRSDAARLFLQEHLPEALPAAPGTSASAADASLPVDLAIEGPRVQAALERARAGFAGQPVLRGEVLTALALRFRVLGQPEQAQGVLQEAVNLLQTTARPDEPALGAARAELA
ncbi:hypothetical protein IP87_13315, partial [beta proteobacterium AAP121]